MSSGWPNLSDLIVDKNADAPIGMVGAPSDAGSVTRAGCDLAPGLLRATLRRIGRYDVETGKELATRDRRPWRRAGRRADHPGSNPRDYRRLQGDAPSGTS